MRRLKRNQRAFTYETIQDYEAKTDAQGYKTGHNDPIYNDPIEDRACIVFKGSSDYKPYGIDEDWSVQIIPNKPLAITVGTRITIDGKTYFVLSHPTTINEQRIFAR